MWSLSRCYPTCPTYSAPTSVYPSKGLVSNCQATLSYKLAARDAEATEYSRPHEVPPSRFGHLYRIFHSTRNEPSHCPPLQSHYCSLAAVSNVPIPTHVTSTFTLTSHTHPSAQNSQLTQSSRDSETSSLALTPSRQFLTPSAPVSCLRALAPVHAHGSKRLARVDQPCDCRRRLRFGGILGGRWRWSETGQPGRG